MSRRTTVTATIFDADGYPFISMRGNPQDVADATSLYVLNIANPLGGRLPLVNLVDVREEEEP